MTAKTPQNLDARTPNFRGRCVKKCVNAKQCVRRASSTCSNAVRLGKSVDASHASRSASSSPRGSVDALDAPDAPPLRGASVRQALRPHVGSRTEEADGGSFPDWNREVH